MIQREPCTSGLYADVCADYSVWPKLTQTAALMMKSSIEKLMSSKLGVEVHLSDKDISELFYDFTRSSGFPEILERSGIGYTLVPMQGNAFAYTRYAEGMSYFVRLYKHANGYVCVAKFHGDFFEVINSFNTTKVSEMRFNPLR